MSVELLDKISSPDDLKELDSADLELLAIELRSQMVAATSLRGGHLASSLGSTELIIALHRVLNCPHDRIIFDVGHQSYAHKLLTGRYSEFMDLRTKDGISGFPKITESLYDSHNSGHASDSLSTALGYAYARDLDGGDQTIVAVIGDASISGGMAMEALNQLANMRTRIIIILNDNGMSISRNVGGMASYLARARLSKKYTTVRDRLEGLAESGGRLTRFLMNTGNAFKESFKQLVLPGGMLFEDLGMTYLGPVDGHDIPALEEIIANAKLAEGPILIHVVTKKGKGYEPAEEHPEAFHGVSPFVIDTGEPKKKSMAPSWTKVFGEELISIADRRDDLVAITAAMPSGTGLDAFGERFPERFIDVGIAEEHAVTMASSLALAGKIPVVAIYSTFLQRCFDQIMINVALQDQHVVLCLDRAGLVGEDGPTHHGAFDLSYLRIMPNMTILAPSDSNELRAALHYAVEEASGPVAVRYPRGIAIEPFGPADTAFAHGARVLRHGTDVSILAVGNMAYTALQAAGLLEERGIDAAVYDMRFVKPLDLQALRAAAENDLLVTLEDNSVCGGFGSGILEALSQEGLCRQTLVLGLPDAFTGQGSIAELHASYGLDAEGVCASVCTALGR